MKPVSACGGLYHHMNVSKSEAPATSGRRPDVSCADGPHAEKEKDRLADGRLQDVSHHRRGLLMEHPYQHAPSRHVNRACVNCCGQLLASISRSLKGSVREK